MDSSLTQYIQATVLSPSMPSSSLRPPVSPRSTPPPFLLQKITALQEITGNLKGEGRYRYMDHFLYYFLHSTEDKISSEKEHFPH